MNNKSSAYGVIMLLLVAAVAWISKGLFPSVFRTILIFVVILGAGLLVLLALVLYFAFKKPEEKKTAENEAKEVLAKGRSHLMELRRLGMQVKNPDIRKKVDQICALIDKIFQTLKEQPKHILPTRKFFHYYLPTMKAIIQKYVFILIN